MYRIHDDTQSISSSTRKQELLPCPQDREIKTTEANEGGGVGGHPLRQGWWWEGRRAGGGGDLRKCFILIRSSQPSVSADSQRAWKTDK